MGIFPVLKKMHPSMCMSGHIHMGRLFLQLTVLSFSYIFWLLPEFLVVNRVVPVKLKEHPVFWGPPFVLLAPLLWVFLQDLFVSLSLGLGHLSLRHLLASFLSSGSGVMSGI